jgi:NAD(P)-dependent dehydrogenase (short-subunit alcohol dehydrogenase family)
MSGLRFDGRVAIVTGAGVNPGMGRAYARYLAQLGAKVVVNDLGVGPDGRRSVRADPDAVVAEIVAAGGEAVADHHSVAEEASARAIVQTALDTWGRLDIVVNNAGVGIVAGFEEITTTDLRTMIDVHLFGTIWMCRAAWPVLREAGYGRIVNITSGGMFGMPGLTVYGAAKGGIFGLTRGLGLEGAPLGIRVNALSPGGATVAAEHSYTIDPGALEAFKAQCPPELVAPAVAYLAHESCEIAGTLLHASAGRVAATMFADTAGFHDPALTIDLVHAHLGEVLDTTSLQVLTDPYHPGGSSSENADLFVPKPYRPA